MVDRARWYILLLQSWRFLIAFYILIRPLGFHVSFGMLPLNFQYDEWALYLKNEK